MGEKILKGILLLIITAIVVAAVGVLFKASNNAEKVASQKAEPKVKMKEMKGLVDKISEKY